MWYAEFLTSIVMFHGGLFRKYSNKYRSRLRIIQLFNIKYLSQSCIDQNSTNLFIFDIDGVFLRGKKLINQSKDAIDYLTKTNTNYVFLTNNSSMTENDKAQSLSELLGTKIKMEQLFMAQTPLRQFTEFYDKSILVIGGGNNSPDTIKECGYSKVFDVRTVMNKFNTIDDIKNLNSIEGIIILSDTDNSEQAIQSIIDLIICQGKFDENKDFYNEFIHSGAKYMSKKYNWQQLPIFLMSTDYLWVTESKYPRLTSGAFIHQLEITYEIISGRKLEYKYLCGKPYEETYKFIWKNLERKPSFENIKNIIFVGDNKLTDIYGANLFKLKYSEKIKPRNIKTVLVSTGVDKDNNISIRASESLPYSRYINGNLFNDDKYLRADHFVNNVYDAVTLFSEEII